MTLPPHGCAVTVAIGNASPANKIDKIIISAKPSISNLTAIADWQLSLGIAGAEAPSCSNLSHSLLSLRVCRFRVNFA